VNQHTTIRRTPASVLGAGIDTLAPDGMFDGFGMQNDSRGQTVFKRLGRGCKPRPAQGVDAMKSFSINEKCK